jgi:CRISPR-associated protein Cmr3
VSTTWLAVEPLDTIMVRDGRPFDAGAASSARSAEPAPNTLGGVVRAAAGRDVRRIIGPLVQTPTGLVFPTPCDVVRDDRTVRRLTVTKRNFTARSDLDPDDGQRLRHHLVGEGEPVSEWITRRGLTDWLTGDLAGGQELWPALLRADPGWVAESRLGLARHWSGPLAGTAASGLLYAMTQLRPRDGTRFLVGCVDGEPVEIRDQLVPFGGRGRLAEVTVVTDPVLPARPDGFPGGRLAVYLATPALLTSMWWHPPEAELSALAVPGPRPVPSATPGAGFAGSRLLAWAVPAGSVFFLTFGSAEAALDWANQNHGGLLPHQSEQRIVTAGFGTCLTGRWTWNDGC